MPIDNSLKISAIEPFIEREREKAICFLVKTYSVSQDDAEDIVQDSSLALFNNIKSGKLVKLTSTLSTYFLQICINQTRDFKKRKPFVSFDAAFEVTQKDDYSESKIDELLGFGESSITDEQKSIMQDLVQNLPKPCNDILWYYYGDNLDMKAIAQLLDYSSADTVKTTKSRCMSKLKAQFAKKKDEFYG